MECKDELLREELLPGAWRDRAAQQCVAGLAQAVHLQLLDRAVVHLGELLYEAAQAEWAAREAKLTKRAVATVEPRSAKRRRGRQQAVAVSDDLFIGADSERADGEGCPGAGCEGHVDVPEPEHCALEGVPVDQAAVGLKGQITFVKGDATRPILDTGHSVVAP